MAVGVISGGVSLVPGMSDGSFARIVSYQYSKGIMSVKSVRKHTRASITSSYGDRCGISDSYESEDPLGDGRKSIKGKKTYNRSNSSNIGSNSSIRHVSKISVVGSAAERSPTEGRVSSKKPRHVSKISVVGSAAERSPTRDRVSSRKPHSGEPQRRSTQSTNPEASGSEIEIPDVPPGRVKGQNRTESSGSEIEIPETVSRRSKVHKRTESPGSEIDISDVPRRGKLKNHAKSSGSRVETPDVPTMRSKVPKRNESPGSEIDISDVPRRVKLENRAKSSGSRVETIDVPTIRSKRRKLPESSGSEIEISTKRRGEGQKRARSSGSDIGIADVPANRRKSAAVMDSDSFRRDIDSPLVSESSNTETSEGPESSDEPTDSSRFSEGSDTVRESLSEEDGHRVKRAKKTKSTKKVKKVTKFHVMLLSDIPAFEGVEEGTGFEYFRREMESFLQVNCEGMEEGTKKMMLKGKLGSLAGEVYRQVAKLPLRDILKKLREVFGNKNGSNMYKRELMELKQSDSQGVKDFATHVYNAGKRLIRKKQGHKDDVNLCMIFALFDGLKDRYLASKLKTLCGPSLRFFRFSAVRIALEHLAKTQIRGDRRGETQGQRSWRPEDRGRNLRFGDSERRGLTCNFWASGRDCPFEKKPGGCKMLHSHQSGKTPTRGAYQGSSATQPPAQVNRVGAIAPERLAKIPRFSAQNTEPCYLKLQFLWQGVPYEEPNSYEGDAGSRRNLMRLDMAKEKLATGEVLRSDYEPPLLEYANESVGRGIMVVLAEMQGFAFDENGKEIQLVPRIIQFVVVESMPTKLLVGREAAATWGIQLVFSLPGEIEIIEDQKMLREKMRGLLMENSLETEVQMQTCMGDDRARDMIPTFRIAEKDKNVYEAEQVSAELRRRVREKVKNLYLHGGLNQKLSNKINGMVQELFEEFPGDQRGISSILMEEEIWANVVGALPTFSLRALDEVVCPVIESAISNLSLPSDLGEAAGILLDKISQIEGIEVSPGYELRIKALEGKVGDTARQKYFSEISFKLEDVEEGVTEKEWDATFMVNKLKSHHREAYEKDLDKYVEAGFWVKRGSTKSGGAPLCTVFPAAPTEEKSTKVRAVCDQRPINARTPKVSNTQASNQGAVTELRAYLHPGYVVRQLDLNKAFYRIFTRVENSKGERILLNLRTHRGIYESDRLVFGLACGPLVLNCVQRVIRCVVLKLLTDVMGINVDDLGIVQVMDDFLLIGPPEVVERAERAFEVVWDLLGFESSLDKRWTWSKEQPTRWLGAWWVWESDTGLLKITKRDVLGDSLQLTKRNVYEMAGGVQFYTGSQGEAMAVGHANVARKIAGQENDWDSQLSIKRMEAVAFHLKEMAQHWENAKKEDVPLFSGITSLVVETDASLSGYGFCSRDALSGAVLFADSKIASPSMKVQEWHCNRCELFAILLAVRKVSERIRFLPSLRSLSIQTDSVVAASHCDRYARKVSGSNERVALVRMGATLHSFLDDFENLDVIVTVSHIAGVENQRADKLSRIPEMGAYKDIVFGNAKSAELLKCGGDQNKVDPVRRVATVDSSWFIKPDTSFLRLKAFQTWWTRYVAFHGWRGKRVELSEQVIRDFIRSCQEDDPHCIALREQILKGETPHLHEIHGGVLVLREPVSSDYGKHGALRQVIRVVFPVWLAKEYIHLVHQECGHLGVKGTLARVRMHVDSVRLSRLVRKTLGECEGCKRTTGPATGGDAESFGPVPLPRVAFAHLGIDLFGPLRRPANTGLQSEDDDTKAKHILTVCCRRTGFTKFFVIPNAEAKTVCESFSNILRSWGCEGIVEEIWSDNGMQFMSAAFKALVLRLPGVKIHCEGHSESGEFVPVKHKRIPVGTPHLGGFYETHHREAKRAFRAVLAEFPDISWEVLASLAEAKVNFYRVDGLPSPFQLVFGREPVLAVERFPLSAIAGFRQSNETPFANSLVLDEASKLDRFRDEFDRVWADHYRHSRVLAAGRKRLVGSKIQVGDQVWLPQKDDHKKFAASWDGPFEVTERVGKLVKLSGKNRWFSVALLKQNQAGSVASDGADDREDSDSSSSQTPAQEVVSEVSSSTGSDADISSRVPRPRKGWEMPDGVRSRGGSGRLIRANRRFMV